MTEGMYNSFIRSLLRRGSQRWPPISEIKKKARVDRGMYLCNICKEVVPVSLLVDGKRKRNVEIDHISPIVTPSEGFVDWNKFIGNLFCEEINLQVSCSSCHAKKSKEESELRASSKNNKKEQDVQPI